MCCRQMVSLIRDPNGEKIFEKTVETQDMSLTVNHRVETAEDKETRISQLEAKITQLEVELECQKVFNINCQE